MKKSGDLIIEIIVQFDKLIQNMKKLWNNIKKSLKRKKSVNIIYTGDGKKNHGI